MSATTQDRIVPFAFDDYLAKRGAHEVEPQKCTGCLRDGGRWEYGNNVYCEPCGREAFGFDKAEETMVRAIIGYAVAAALDAGASDELVQTAVDDALSDRIRVED